MPLPNTSSLSSPYTAFYIYFRTHTKGLQWLTSPHQDADRYEVSFAFLACLVFSQYYCVVSPSEFPSLPLIFLIYSNHPQKRRAVLARMLNTLSVKSFGDCKDKEYFLKGWFLDSVDDVTKLRRGNVDQWFAWALFYRFPSDLSPAERIELQGLVCPIDLLITVMDISLYSSSSIIPHSPYPPNSPSPVTLSLFQLPFFLFSG